MTKYIKLYFFWVVCSLIIISLFSCNEDTTQVKFDKEKWSHQIDPLFPSPYRTKMLIDLTKKHKLVGLRYSQLIDFLGIPDEKGSSFLSYKVTVDYGRDIDPVYTKDLVFNFSKDSIITSFRVKEWMK